MIAAFAFSSACIRLDIMDFLKNIGKEALTIFGIVNSDTITVASFLPFKALQIITAVVLFVFSYIGIAVMICGAAVGLYVLWRKFFNKLMGNIMLYITVPFFIFADILNLREHIGLNSIVIILLINIGVFTVIAIKRHFKKDYNKYSFKDDIHNLKAKLKDPLKTPKPTEDDSILGEGIENCDIAELVRKKYAKRQFPEKPKSSFAEALSIIFKYRNIK